MMAKYKACANCKHCGLDMKALDTGLLIDMCHLKKRHIRDRWFSGFWCKAWRAKDGN